MSKLTQNSADTMSTKETVKKNKVKKVKSKIYHLMSPDGVSIENLYTGERWVDVKSAVENFTTDLISSVTKEFFANPENEGKKTRYDCNS